MSRAAIAAMTAYTLELRTAEVKLNQNENPFDFPEELKRQLLDDMLQRKWNRYPDFESQALRDAIAKAYGLAADNILVGNGSNELLAAAIGTFVGPGTQVVIPRPTFTLYDKLVTVAGGSVKHVEIDPRTGLLPLDDMLVDNAVIIVCSPNNPTGGVLPEGGVQKLLDTGSVVLFDRAYGDFQECGTGTPASADPQTGVSAAHDRLVTFSTFSKAWGLAGLRVGWLASTAATAREIRKVKLPYSLNIISEAAAALALENRAIRDRNVATIVAERERVYSEMSHVVECFPTKANFITFGTKGGGKPPHSMFEGFCARGILVRDVSSYHGLAGCLRVSIGSREENDRFLAALKEIA